VDLVGRDRELSVVSRALDDVCAGTTRSIAVIGEAGIGKSALLGAIAEQAGARGLAVRRTRAAAHERYVPRAAVVPALTADLGGTVLLIDDVHWADEESIDLLLDLVSGPPAEPYLLVVASRLHGSGPGLRLFGEARRSAGFEELVLDPLDRDASLAVLADVADPEERERMLSGSRGNPLYLTEYVRRPGARNCPLLASVEAELAMLSEGARALVEGAAVAGDPFDPQLAAAAAGHELDASAVDELVAADLVRPEGGPTFAFRHPMVCRTVYNVAAPAWRLGAHERAAAALERRGASAAARARHVARYALPGDEAAVALLVEAAEGGAAAHWYEAALRIAPEERRSELLGPLGVALARAGRLAEARDALASATEPQHVVACARVERLLGDPDAAHRRLIAAYEATPHPALAFELIPEGPEWAALAAETDDPVLLAGLDGGTRLRALDDAVLAANLPVVARIARAQLLDGRLDDAAATSTRALAIARRTHQEDTLVELHELRATVLWLHLDLDGALLEAEAAEAVAARQGVAFVPRLRALLHHDRGEAAEAEACMRESVPGRLDPADRWAGHATQLALPASDARAACANAELLLADGDAAGAAELAQAACAVAMPLDAAEARLLAGRAWAAAGDTERAKTALQQVAADAGRGAALRLRDAAARELRALGTRIAPRNRHVAGGDLTDRERTVAELVAGGRSNKQVAAELFLSEGTIENTLTRVYAKLGVRSRTQLTRVLVSA
jgi:DNA-binding NarL/FixJ family response regulator